MFLQTRHWQDQILAAAEKAGELDRIYFMVELTLPARYAKIVGTRRILAQHPLGFLPVVCAAPDYAAARETADLLCYLVRAAQRDWLTGGDKGIEYKVVICYKDDMPSPYWYEWWAEWAGGEPAHTVDRICPGCGAITQAPRNAHWCCDACGVRMDAEGIPYPDC